MEQEIIESLKNIQNFIDSGGNGWINTLTGGLLALVGAFGVQIIHQSSEKRKERKYFLREKLEYIGKLLIEFDSELQKDMAMIVGTAAPEDEGKIPAVQSKLQELKLEICLYYFDMSDDIDLLEKSCSKYFEIKRKLIQEKNESGRSKPDTIQSAYSKFEECIALKNKIFSNITDKEKI